MTSLATATTLPVGHVFEIQFPTFTPRITVLSETQLTFEIIAGDYLGLTETVDYEILVLRPGLFVVTWQEKSKATVVHVEDFADGKVHTNITFNDGSFVRMSGDVSTPA
jgi:hypothetical protein